MITTLSQPKEMNQPNHEFVYNVDMMTLWRENSIWVKQEESDLIWDDVVFTTLPDGKWTMTQKIVPKPVEVVTEEQLQVKPKWVEPNVTVKRTKKEVTNYPSLAKAATITQEQVDAMKLKEELDAKHRAEEESKLVRMCWSYRRCRRADCTYAHSTHELFPKRCSSRRCDRNTCLYIHRDESLPECRTRILWIVDNRRNNNPRNNTKGQRGNPQRDNRGQRDQRGNPQRGNPVRDNRGQRDQRGNPQRGNPVRDDRGQRDQRGNRDQRQRSNQRDQRVPRESEQDQKKRNDKKNKRSNQHGKRSGGSGKVPQKEPEKTISNNIYDALL